MSEWSFDEDVNLHRLWVVEARSAGEIARILGRSRSAIQGRAYRRGWTQGDGSPAPDTSWADTPSKPWTDGQIEFLRLNWRQHQDEELAALLSQIGPERSVKAVEDRRRRLGLHRPRGATAGCDIVTRSAYVDEDPWPPLKGTQEQRDKLYLKRLFEGLREEHRRLASRQSVAA